MQATVELASKSEYPSGNIYFSEIGDSGRTFNDYFTITPGGSVDLHLPLNLTNSATSFDLATYGTPILSLGSSDLFGSTPDVMVDIGLGPVLQDEILTVLSSLDESADSISSSIAMSRVLPGINLSFNGLLDSEPSGRRWGDLLKFEQVAADYFASFDPTSEQFDPSNVGLIPTALGLRDAIVHHLQATETPLTLSGGVDLATNMLTFDLALAVNANQQVPLSFDSAGSEWTNTGITFGVDAVATVNTTANIQASFGVSLDRTAGVKPSFDLNQFDVAVELDATG
jgi:hypothetical protein